MTDRMTPEQRHRCMSNIRATDTKPELIVRKWLWSHGFRYGLHNKNLPGKPDIVLRKYKTIVLVNGCFWHGHNATPLPDGEIAGSECCKIPLSNRRFWLDKINRNMRRDKETLAKLTAKGWRVITVWECQLRPKLRQETLENLLRQLSPSQAKPLPYSLPEEERAIAAEGSLRLSPPKGREDQTGEGKGDSGNFWQS